MSCCNKSNIDKVQKNHPSELYLPLTLHKKKTEKKNNIKESFCNIKINQYGEERSVKDIQMLKEFGCKNE